MTDAEPRPRDRSRPYDIVLWGATGFTGRLVAEHLVRTRADGELRLALAGRSRDKLEALRRELAAIDPAARELPIELADSFDAAALDALMAKTTVVCTTVGPYAKYGAELVAACVRQGTDYCDLTGEVPFIRTMIDRHHDAAHQAGARIVCCCGFDSIPSDLGTFMMQQAFRKRHGVPARQVKLAVRSTKGGFSGGTVASMVEIAQAARHDPETRRLLLDPYALDPADGRRGPDGRDPHGVGFDDDFGGWTAPFVMAAVNTRVVRRSNALMAYAYGEEFGYQEFMTFPRGPKGRLRAAAVARGLVAFMVAVALGPTRSLMQRFVLPAPGEGPDQAAREAGYFTMRLLAKGPVGGGEQEEIFGRVEGHKDPGYGATAIMLGESARCLAIDPVISEGGVITPTVAMGELLLGRLRAAGMIFAVE
ncbi:MAG: saccharopine dehydrogenase NADP-binding domain-containing protein [Myxococcales bacterium]|nr:saccharopine dehydrogenase NADP-binding domain-containing protein [Myxococcales bacterium]MCB9718023.1 saccharopine dehydrogenase NADP-binding domain-containing protein [Myxococcales bacterium]